MTPGFTRDFQPTLLRNARENCILSYGTITLYRAPFQMTFDTTQFISEARPQHHISLRIRFELCRFRSPLLTTSRLISSPAPTKMFQFGAFPIVSYDTIDDESSGCPIQESQVHRFHASTLGLSQLGTPFISFANRAIQ